MGIDINAGKKRAVTAIAIVGILLVASVGSWAFMTRQNNDQEPTLYDALGRAVYLPEVPERVVSCIPSMTETLYAMGLGSTLVGVTKYCDYPQDVVDRKNNATDPLAQVGSFTTPSLVAIVPLEPDLVLLDETQPNHLSVLPQLEAMNITALVVHDAEDLDSIYANLRLLGKAFDKAQVAEDCISAMGNRISGIQERMEGQDEPVRVAYIVSVTANGITVAGGSNFIDNNIVLAGAVNVFGNLTTAWPLISLEYLALMNPGVIITGPMGSLNTAAELQNNKGKDIWKDIDAIKNDMIYNLQDRAKSVLDRASTSFPDAVELIAMAAHPGEFTNVLPKNVGNNYQDYFE